jgi:hypothetical protein
MFKRTHKAILLLCIFLLSACALPMPTKVTGFVLEGVSLMTTKKTIADHGVSAFFGRDCSLVRAVSGDDICTRTPIQD